MKLVDLPTGTQVRIKNRYSDGSDGYIEAEIEDRLCEGNYVRCRRPNGQVIYFNKSRRMRRSENHWESDE